MRAFQMIAGSRDVDVVVLPDGRALPKPVAIQLRDIVEYMELFPEDVDEPRKFIRIIQAIDQEFLKHGLKSNTKRSR